MSQAFLALPSCRPLSLAMLFVALLTLTGCETMNFKAREALFGTHKREILVDRVEDARDAQTEAKEQFSSALEEFMAVVKVDGGELEQRYNAFKRELDRSEARADAVHDRIKAVESVAQALFSEWEAELDQYERDDLRRKAQKQMFDTRERYDELVSKMKAAESKMEPVLVAFRDQVLFLKHNLNARAIASIDDEVGALESDIAALVADMEQSIAEANDFIESMSGESPG